MNIKIKARYALRARVMKAMSHPTRLFLVDELSKGERCVLELTKVVGDDMSTVSKHLTVLKHAGLVSDDKRGNQVFYSLKVRCAVNFFSCVESVLKADAKKRGASAR